MELIQIEAIKTSDWKDTGGFRKDHPDFDLCVDSETGVQYLVGYASKAICPRYNADGSLYVDKSYIQK